MGVDAQQRFMVTSPPRRPRVAVIGAGPAGLMAAEVAAGAGLRVTVYERMVSPARKLLMAGRGGLNLTHSEGLATFLGRYGAPVPAALRAAIEAFDPAALTAWANGLGIETFTGSSGRIFPRAMKASPLLRAWLGRLDRLGVRIVPRHTFTGLDQHLRPFVAAPGESPSAITTDATILALGGASWPRLGGDGSWVGPLSALGLPVRPLTASNAAALVAWTPHFLARAEGQALKRIAVTAGERTVRGEAVVTRAGLEGGAVYALSEVIGRATAQSPVTLAIDLKPDATESEIVQRLLKPRGKLSMANFLRRSLALSPAGIALMREAAPHHQVPAGPEALARLVKSLPVTTAGHAGLARAISTAGGLRFDALDEHLMIRTMPGVFVAGEMLDWDAPTGGYLLQAAFSTGVHAGRGAVSWLERQAHDRRSTDASPRDGPSD